MGVCCHRLVGAMKHILCQRYDLTDKSPQTAVKVEHLARFFWRWELLKPEFYRVSMGFWRTNFKQELSFLLNDCDRLYCYQLFGGRPVALIALQELVTEPACMTHFFYAPHLCCKLSDLIALFCELRNNLFREGFETIRAEYLKQNFTLKKLLDAVGFIKLPLTKSYGSYRHKQLIWQMVEIRQKLLI